MKEAAAPVERACIRSHETRQLYRVNSISPRSTDERYNRAEVKRNIAMKPTMPNQAREYPAIS